jgi:uncharacterized protein (DUF2252 family)
LADEARATAARIRDRLNTSVFDTGRDLIAIKDKMEHGAFGDWLKAEFNFTARTAQNYMNAVGLLDRKNETVSLLSPTVVYALAAPSASAAVVNEVLAAAEIGNVMSPSVVKKKLATAIEAERHAAREAKKSPEQIAKEHKTRKSKAKREERYKAEQVAEKAREARQEQERTDRFTPLVKRIVAAIGPEDLAALNKIFRPHHWCEQKTVARLLAEAAEALA